jgi:hypothetical protein
MENESSNHVENNTEKNINETNENKHSEINESNNINNSSSVRIKLFIYM